MEGKVFTAEYHGAFVIKMQGDIRLTLCSTLDEYMRILLDSDGVMGVVVDLSDVECIDSTSLGMLAKLAIKSKQQFNFVPVMVSPNPDINRLLQSMGFNKVFEIYDHARREQSEANLGELEVVSASEDSVREKVIEAHKALMEMDEKNHDTFAELVVTLEGANK